MFPCNTVQGLQIELRLIDKRPVLYSFDCFYTAAGSVAEGLRSILCGKASSIKSFVRSFGTLQHLPFHTSVPHEKTYR
ncbi:unnamed protein product [Chondrus crispus]|uniref:Uncharacterized protein n=1 Tax=Chondrus crispus TaxID=2769 RepID=R7QN86_CHOCR|nr:unnamed protein product [Chondrus crispus]CDF39544.1 unnamed protein product [Chondrus crispus]|eukprot:XP_005709838.1 unnamed protein product [Chondrus crispus]